MTDLKRADNELSTAAAPLMIYCALAGVCGFFMLVISFVLWPPQRFGLIAFGIIASISLALGILAWGIRNERRWAWIPAVGFAAVFATVFPIGTIISYFALSALWKCRESFFPFSIDNAEQDAALEVKAPE